MLCDRDPSGRTPQARTGGWQPVGLKKGLAITYLREFVHRRFGEAAWEDLIAELPRPETEILRAVEPIGWYDLGLHADINRRFCDRFRGGSLSIAQELGRFSAEQDFANYSWILRIASPLFIIRNMGMYWRRGDETGHLSARMNDDELHVRLSDWGIVEPVLCQRFLGYLGRMLEFFGPVTTLEHHRCRAFGAPACEFRLRWQIRSTRVDHESTPTMEEFVRAAFELSQYDGFDDLADGIVHLFSSCSSGSHVKLWIRDADNGEPRLVRSTGESHEREGNELRSTCCFVLWSGERAVGRVDVTNASKLTEPFRWTLESLLPAIAATIERVSQASASRPRDADAGAAGLAGPSDAMAGRLLKAKASWGLTDRETQVLRLLALGNSNKEISAKLRIEEGTVDAHLSRIRSKCHVNSSRLVLVMFWSEA
ncbi:hypothetical protein BE21_54590 [Sorangium cellulosum]|uniref:HTH luxR-type domain-containing protein n=1 Tax=Sorangium cellulosum TaxID=56 RepID=A0A150TDI5_SORCE|nr:hypothetical protein BE21_54590 [Sorangium cellulosum]